MSLSLKPIFEQCYNLNNKFNIVLANGQFPKNDFLIDLIKSANCVICCDGAINNLEHYQIVPDYIIGDCDSLDENLRQKYNQKIKQLSDQDTNDLTKAINFAATELNLDNIIILGATGLREDHGIANIALLADYVKIIKDTIILSDYGFFSVHSGTDVVSTVPIQQISIFAIQPDTRVTTYGLKWDLDNQMLDSWHKGTLNQAQSNNFKLISSKQVMVFRSFEIKN